MKKITTALNNLQETRMTSEERRRMWQTIDAKISNSSNFTTNFNTQIVRNQNPRRPYIWGWVSIPDTRYFTKKRVKRSLSIFTVSSLIVGGSLSAYADIALPGETLYPIKIYVNEKAKILLAFGHESKAKIEMNLALLRLNEAKLLAKEGKLNPEIEEETKIRFGEHTTNFETHLIALSAEGNLHQVVETGRRFEQKINEYETALDQMTPEFSSKGNRDYFEEKNYLTDLREELPLFKETTSLIVESVEDELDLLDDQDNNSNNKK